MDDITNFQGEVTLDNGGTLGDHHVSALIIRVGKRVRKARERKGIPRRVLSETSGVSPRYLAQLEAGEGNISIGLLQRIATALDHRIEWLMGEDDPWDSDVLRVADMYRSSNAEVQQRILQILNSDSTGANRGHRICLVGLRGAGKSTLGALAGKAVGMPFVELNHEIEEQSGMPVAEVMAFYGQEGYRKLEAQAISRIIATYDTMILAVSGGIVAAPDTYNQLLENFQTVWLKTTPEEHMARVRAQGDERPMAGNPEAMEQLKSILASRETLYEKAMAQIDTSGKTVNASLSELLDVFEARNFSLTAV